MKTVAFIHARGNGSRFAGKHLADIAGKPVIRHVVEHALDAKLVDDVVLSTNDDAIADAAFYVDEGLVMRLQQPDWSNSADGLEVLGYASGQYRDITGNTPDVTLCCSGNTPVMVSGLLDEILQLQQQTGGTLVTAVQQATHHHPYYAIRRTDQGIKRFLPSADLNNSGDFDDAYMMIGAPSAWKGTGPPAVRIPTDFVVVKPHEYAHIHDELDLEYARWCHARMHQMVGL